MLQIDNNWTLFLDRDGVINKNIDKSYVLNWDEFEFVDGVLETMPKLAKIFPRIIVVTNQQCIAKGLLIVEGLIEIHQNMMNMIELNGGRIDAVYYAPDKASPQNLLRKPGNGMALLAKNDFPEIDFKKCIMVGDKLSDMEFGKSLGMTTIYLSNTYVENLLIDIRIKTFENLMQVIKY
jgi:histidinol-phosphate phosphatase family protein